MYSTVSGLGLIAVKCPARLSLPWLAGSLAGGDGNVYAHSLLVRERERGYLLDFIPGLRLYFSSLWISNFILLNGFGEDFVFKRKEERTKEQG